MPTDSGDLSAGRGPVLGDVDDRIWRRARPFVAEALEGQPEATREAFQALLDARRLSFGFDRADDRLWLVFGALDAGEEVPFVRIHAGNAGLWETDDGLVYVPDQLLDSDLASLDPVRL